MQEVRRYIVLVFVWLCCAVAIRAAVGPRPEPPGPASRATGLVISEVMYHPPDRSDGRRLAFIELYNSSPFPEDIGGYRLSGDISFTFTPGTIIAAGQYLVVADRVVDFNTAYPNVSNVVGNFTGTLSKDNGAVRLRNRSDAILLKVDYYTDPPWPVLPDGKGYSLVLARPSYGESDPRAWAASAAPGGSPGQADLPVINPWINVVINEFLANPGPSDLDFIELYNRGTQDVELTGCSLSDNPDTNKFVFQGTTIPAGGYLALDEFSLGFGLKADGDTIYFRSPFGSVVDVGRYKAQSRGISQGRIPEGAREFYPLNPPTPFAQNTSPHSGDVVINEIMYAPISGETNDEYIELFNRSSTSIDVGGWQFSSGITFTIPASTVIPSNGYLVVVHDLSRAFSNYPNLSPANTVGNFSGVLSDDGERITLLRPEALVQNNMTNLIYVVADEVTYGTSGNHRGRWGRWSRHGGSSLELTDARSENRFGGNWADSDESQKASWTTIEFTGQLDNGAPVTGVSELFVMLLGAGECLVDDVEVIVQGNNLITNSTFNTSATGWVTQGNHERSTWTAEGSSIGSGSLHLRASGPGHAIGNCVKAALPVALTSGTVTLRAKGKWLRGHPDLLLRLSGNYLEAAGKLSVPGNLGTPGSRNSRAVPNAGPAIAEVQHAPAIPGGGQSVLVTAQFNDPDGIGQPVLRYRVDSSTTYTPVLMNDNGTGGDVTAFDGIFSAILPGQSPGSLAAFYIEVGDASPAAATSHFPYDAPARECHVRFGETASAGAIGTYRIWMSASNLNRWTPRDPLSDEPLDCTLIYGTNRIIYNAGIRYGGDIFARTNFNSPLSSGNAYVITLPSDEMLFGEDELLLEAIDPSRDSTALRERTAIWMGEQLGLAVNNQRFVHVALNGINDSNRGIAVFVDRQLPNTRYLENWFGENIGGELFEATSWLEPATNAPFSNVGSANLAKHTTADGVKKKARYRATWPKREDGLLDDDYSSLFELVDTLTTLDSTYLSSLAAQVDIEQWISALAFRHVLGDWDCYGYLAGRNAFLYRGTGASGSAQRWKLLFGRVLYALGSTGGDGPTANPFAIDSAESSIARIYNEPALRRVYLRALQKAVNGPLLLTNVQQRFLDPVFQGLQSNGVVTTSPSASGLLTWISERRNYLLGQIPTSPFALSGTNTINTSNNLVTLTGTAPLDLQTITVNGIVYPVTWTTATNWVVRFAVNQPQTVLSIVGLNTIGVSIGSLPVVTINFSGVVEQPQDFVVINEIMYRPSVTNAAYIEVVNRSAGFAFDLSNWRLDGVEYAFPPGTFITNGQYLVVAQNAEAFGRAYGTSIPVLGEYSGSIDLSGEKLALLKPLVGKSGYQVIDAVRFEPGTPWPSTPVGAALQLIDSSRDNSRVSNWSDGSEWRYVTMTGTPIFAGSTNLTITMNSSGDFYLDDISLVAGTVAEVGANLLENGGFEAGLLNPWAASGNHSASMVSTATRHSGNASLHVIASGAGISPTATVLQPLTNLVANAPYTLSFWYLPSTNGNGFNYRLSSNFRSVAAVELAPWSHSPGSRNQVAGTVTDFPLLWINEVHPGPGGLADQQGEYEPWVEIHNSGGSVIVLDGYALASSYTNLGQWLFPSGTVINPGEFKVVFVDGQPEQSTASGAHANFRLTPTNGVIVLSKNGRILDYINYRDVDSDLSYGSYPDGQLIDRQILYQPTPGVANNPAPRVIINEWLASNTSGLIDPANNNHEDWIELYNAGTHIADLSGYFLSDNLADHSRWWPIPAGTRIAPKDFLFVWADNAASPSTSTNLHANFQLRAGGEEIGLFAPNGYAVDTIIFSAQQNNVSQGRFPDGNVAGVLYFMNSPTPLGTNVIPQNQFAPALPTVANKVVEENKTLSFQLAATDMDTPKQTLTYSFGAGAPEGAVLLSSGFFSWTPTEQQGGETYSIIVNVTDNGSPELTDTKTFAVIVNKGNSPPTLDPLSDRSVVEGGTVAFTAHAVDSDIPTQNLSFSLEAGFPAGANIDPLTGAFSWTPTILQSPSTNLISVRVMDDGVPNLAGTQSFAIIVRASIRITAIQQVNAEDLSLTWHCQPGKRYQLEYKDNFCCETAWQVVPNSEVTATGSFETLTIKRSAGPQRFYRIVGLD